MSLHLANLSPRIRKDELEHVFRRFGRCMVQLKYGFGFAVYDFHGDAEKALRSLKGRKICGESVYLSWSNKQPKPLERFARAARSPDMPYGRNSVRRDSFVGRNISRSYGATSDRKQADKGRERPKFSEIHDDRPDFNHKNVGTVHYDRRDVILEAGGHLGVEPNPSDNGRWEERADICHNGTGSNGQMGFDRYMPDCAAEIGEKYENHGSEYLDGPQTIGTSPEKNRRVHPDKRRGQQTCFKCGAVGHKMRDCQLEEDLPEKRKYHSDYGHDRKGKNGVGKLDSESRSTGWLQSGHRNSRPARLHDTDRKLSYLEKSGVNSTSFPMANESGRDKNKDCNRKRRQEVDDHVVETHDDKKSRMLDSPHLHPDYTSPELGTHSRSVKPSVGLSSRSRSGSLMPHSLSVSSRSLSKSNRSRSTSRSPRSKFKRLETKSRSRSSSRSPSSSLSISLGHSLPPSPKQAEVNLNGFSEHVSSPRPKEAMTEVREHMELEEREENPCIANRVETSLNGFTGNTTSNQLMEVPLERKQSKHDSDTQPSTSLDGFMEDDQIPPYQEAVLEERQCLEVKTMQDNEPPQIDVSLQSEDASFTGKVMPVIKLDQVHNDGVSDSTPSHVSCVIKALSSSLLEKDDKEPTAANLAAEKLREIAEIESGIALEMTKPLEPVNNSDMKSPSKLHVGSHLNISTEEFFRVLKHYGFEHSEENIHHLDVGDYFGSSRLWPWEMIYYRRLKKGPISLENYARRVAQNKAFNITDKYIRSSSGWGELSEEQH